jgi:hypothetical protein
MACLFSSPERQQGKDTTELVVWLKPPRTGIVQDWKKHKPDAYDLICEGFHNRHEPFTGHQTHTGGA